MVWNNEQWYLPRNISRKGAKPQRSARIHEVLLVGKNKRLMVKWMAGEKGECTPKITNVMTELAEGEVGLIISSHAYVQRDGQAGPLQLGIYTDDFITAAAAK